MALFKAIFRENEYRLQDDYGTLKEFLPNNNYVFKKSIKWNMGRIIKFIKI